MIQADHQAVCQHIVQLVGLFRGPGADASGVST